MVYRNGWALLAISTVLFGGCPIATAGSWLALSSHHQSDWVSSTEHRCVSILQVKAEASQGPEITFTPPGAAKEPIALTLREDDYAQAIGAPLYVDTLIYNEGRMEVVRSWLHNRVCP
jgi:hypothetical protein